MAARGGTGAAARGRAASTSARTRTRAKKSQSQRQRTQANCDSSNGTSLRGAGARAARERRRVRAARRPLAPRGGVGLCPPLEEDARAGLRRALERARQGLVAVVVAARLLPGERHVRRREQLARAAGAPVGPPRRRHSPQRSPVVVGRGAQIAKCQASSRVKAFTRKKEFLPQPQNPKLWVLLHHRPRHPGPCQRHRVAHSATAFAIWWGPLRRAATTQPAAGGGQK